MKDTAFHFEPAKTLPRPILKIKVNRRITAMGFKLGTSRVFTLLESGCSRFTSMLWKSSIYTLGSYLYSESMLILSSLIPPSSLAPMKELGAPCWVREYTGSGVRISGRITLAVNEALSVPSGSHVCEFRKIIAVAVMLCRSV
jgi:hypothetical protein